LREFAKHIGYDSTYIAELWGDLEGLKHARKVELCVDSTVVVKHITSNEKSRPGGRSLVKHIRRPIALE
jgi:hypothetical protein